MRRRLLFVLVAGLLLSNLVVGLRIQSLSAASENKEKDIEPGEFHIIQE